MSTKNILSTGQINVAVKKTLNLKEQLSVKKLQYLGFEPTFTTACGTYWDQNLVPEIEKKLRAEMASAKTTQEDAQIKEKSNINVLINKRVMHAALLSAAKNDIRFYLNGVYIEFVENDEAFIVGTNGHVMFIKKTTVKYSSTKTLKGTSYIIPYNTVKMAISNCNGEVLELDTGLMLLQGIQFTPIDGKFPDFRKVIPEKCPGELAHFKPEYLHLGEKVIRMINCTKEESVKLFHNGNGAGVMQRETPDDSHLFIVMPVRVNPDRAYMPIRY